MMTDAQKEVAARELCRLRGIDPDTRYAHGADPDPVTGAIPAVLLYSPSWRLVLREIEVHLLMDAAIAAGMAATGGAGV